MTLDQATVRTVKLDSLRLLALGRIPRCSACPRYRALVDAHAGKAESGQRLPRVPAFCNQQVCSPLVVRLWPRPAREAV